MKHPIRVWRELPRWRRVLGAWGIYRVYRGWDNGRWVSFILTWRAVVWR